MGSVAPPLIGTAGERTVPGRFEMAAGCELAGAGELAGAAFFAGAARETEAEQGATTIAYLELR